jgi:hypothetical protein
MLPQFPIGRSGGGDLTANPNHAADVPHHGDMQALEDAYRARWWGMAPQPALLGKATNRAFPQLVEDLRKWLTRSLNPGSPGQTTGRVSFSRRDILQIITARIDNVAPRADRRTRCRLDSRGLVLWATRWGIVAELEGDAIRSCESPLAGVPPAALYLGALLPIDEPSQTVIHHVQAHLIPSRVGTDLRRTYEFSGSTQLILTAVSDQGTTRLVWHRDRA